jgi:anthranilate phosphoribosyltransferase
MIREAIGILVSGQSLTMEQAAQVMDEIMSGEATPAQLSSFVTALRLKGETVEEIAGLASVMRAKAIPVAVSGPVVDTCGTGGDGSLTFNISTAAAFVVAGAGLKVAKHGNRAMSSGCGSIDVLEELGAKIDLNAEQVQECLEKVGIGFMFAPIFHPAMKYAAGPRREIGIRTVFNIVGPLTNPAGAKAQIIGVPESSVLEKVARALHLLGCEHAFVVHGEDGLDEISTCQKTMISELKGDAVETYFITPEEIGLPRASLESLKGGSAQENARILYEVLAGAQGPCRDVVLLNAAAALIAGDKAQTWEEGLELARQAIDNGQSLQKLQGVIELSQSFN